MCERVLPIHCPVSKEVETAVRLQLAGKITPKFIAGLIEVSNRSHEEALRLRKASIVTREMLQEPFTI